jgi:hypothetical protein
MMTIDDLDAYRMAKFLIERHPDDAFARAERRAKRLLKEDADGSARWRRIAEAIDEMTRGRRDDEPLN